MITLIGNLKGGTGKSTVTFNLAVWLAKFRKSPVVFDLDPQRTLADAVEVREEEEYAPSLTLSRDVGELGKARIEETLVDVGTSDMDAMREAVRLAQRILIPVTPSQADLWSTQRFLKIIRQLRDQAAMPQVVAFINRADANRAMRETAETAQALESLSGISFIQPRLTQRTAFRRSFSEGLAVFEQEPRGKAAAELSTLAAALYP